ncbi:TetR/AcrR family transcriptional regulator [Tistrella bauzanensis]|uniref:TetR/AcrR family transcriptional regulator n=1 Tax=Tistrella arctica TaxID=3133430 RepID=A0ABU9YDC4_9PROT
MTDAHTAAQNDDRPIREQQRDQTRRRLLDAAVTSLIELGVARTTTLEVQRRAGASRGALLHHFPSHAALLSATIEELVRRNDAAVRDARSSPAVGTGPVERAIRTLAAMSAQPAFMAELELWAAARTVPDLRSAIQAAERQARGARERVLADLFKPLGDAPQRDAVVAMSVEFLRGLALSSLLSARPDYYERMVTQWVRAAELLLDAPSRPAD